MVIPNFVGQQFARNSKLYDNHRYQYGSSSHPDRVHPAIVAYPTSIADVQAAVSYAKSMNIAVAIRTGGHQYSAASSTVGDNIQLDMSKAFKTVEDVSLNGDFTLLRAGISLNLREFNELLGEKRRFVPHGQCSHVHVGGHSQTGGYGQLGRSFGLFGDHIMRIEFVDANGDHRSAARDAVSAAERDLFFGFLGGSPGNFGVLTHVTVRVHKDEDHPRSFGMKCIYLYNRDLLEELLHVKAAMAADANFPRDIDFCITVLGMTAWSLLQNLGIDEEMRKKHPELFGHDDGSKWPQVIILYVQWANTGGANQDARDEQSARKWFDRIIKLGKKYRTFGNTVLSLLPMFQAKIVSKPMSQLTKDWIFTNVREFSLSYEKRTYVTKQLKDLAGWPRWCADRIDVAMQDPNLRLSIQIQHFGGNNSMFHQNGLSGDTSYSWRDTTICAVMDCFYFEGHQQRALDWQAENDKRSLQYFSAEDRRVLWGSYGSFDLHDSRRFYHEDEAKYNRLCAIRDRVDPQGVFVPNTFCIGWVRTRPALGAGGALVAGPALGPAAATMAVSSVSAATAAAVAEPISFVTESSPLVSVLRMLRPRTRSSAVARTYDDVMVERLLKDRAKLRVLVNVQSAASAFADAGRRKAASKSKFKSVSKSKASLKRIVKEEVRRLESKKHEAKAEFGRRRVAKASSL